MIYERICMKANVLICKRFLRIVEGLATLFVLFYCGSYSHSGKNATEMWISLIGCILATGFLFCRWFLRKEYTKAENFFDFLLGIAFLFFFFLLLL